MAERFDADVALLTGGWDRPYAFGMTQALSSVGLRVDVITGEDLTAADFPGNTRVRLLPFKQWGGKSGGSLGKARRALRYYSRLLRYAWSSSPRLFHILWNNGFDLFDRTLLMAYYRLLGKTIVFTAHNVNAGARDNRDSAINRLTLRCQYRLSHHIFVHTEEMRAQLLSGFGVQPEKVTVIPFGINNAVPRTALTPAAARERLGIAPDDRVLLFFGNIAPYKGLEYLVQAMPGLLASSSRYRLVVAGRVKDRSSDYWNKVEAALTAVPDQSRVILRTEFIPDEETEIYFKAADLLVLPYVHIFQSGVLFLGFSFGLPAAVADVGNLKAEVQEDETGVWFEPRNPDSLRAAVERYFASPLAHRPDSERRQAIIERAERAHSWDAVAAITRNVYLRVGRGELRQPATSSNQ
jgi:D-inositol-3-phosphate glycosyltransferase